MEIFLRVEGYKINASDDALYKFIIQISTGDNKFEQIVDWLKSNTVLL